MSGLSIMNMGQPIPKLPWSNRTYVYLSDSTDHAKVRQLYPYSYRPLPPDSIPAMLMKKFTQHVTSEGFCFEFGCANRLGFMPIMNRVAPVTVLKYCD